MMKTTSTGLSDDGERRVTDAAPEASVTVPKVARASATRVPRLVIRSQAFVVKPVFRPVVPREAVVVKPIIRRVVRESVCPPMKVVFVDDKGRVAAGPKVPVGRKS